MRVQKKDLLAFSLLLAIACLTIAGAANAQTPKPSPSPAPAPAEDTGKYSVTSTVEIGLRGLDVNGDINKFKSDLNYRPGLRVFDSSLLVEDRTNGMKLFDKLLVTTTGFGADPQGAFRMDMEAKGVYRLEGNVRNVRYFNSLNKIALNEHNANTQHNFGDFDLTLFPENAKFRARVGYSFNRTTGDGSITTRPFSDEYQILSDVRATSHDLRAGVEGTLLGFNLGFNYGHRVFDDRTSYFINGLNLGNNLTNSSRLFTFQRFYPTRGMTDFGHFYAQRTFLQKLDFSARFVYSESRSKFSLEENLTARDNSNNFVDKDTFTSNGNANRPQSRGDVGITWRVTNDFRISNTFTFDQFNIGGGNIFMETRLTRSAAGANLAPFFSDSLANRVTSYRRFMNLIEADYQVNNRIAFNVGYRYSHRRVRLDGLDINRLTGAVTPTGAEDVTNTTHSFIAGTRLKPMKNWSIFADFEKGNADNVFTRLANNDFTNFRIRTRANIKAFAISASAITKDNTDPSRSITAPTLNFSARTKNRMYTASFDWTPRADYTFSTGYTFQHLTAVADIRVPINSTYVFGISQYFVRDSYFFFDVSARPIRRVALFASYRISDDRGQGSRVSTRPLQDIISSYPMKYQSPEVRLAIKLTRNIDWNLGYQYYDYKEKFLNAQNYSAHLPYTSLRFYFGRSAEDR